MSHQVSCYQHPPCSSCNNMLWDVMSPLAYPIEALRKLTPSQTYRRVPSQRYRRHSGSYSSLCWQVLAARVDAEADTGGSGISNNFVLSSYRCKAPMSFFYLLPGIPGTDCSQLALNQQPVGPTARLPGFQWRLAA